MKKTTIETQSNRQQWQRPGHQLIVGRREQRRHRV